MDAEGELTRIDGRGGERVDDSTGGERGKEDDSN